jgi:hypothetical protein
MQARLREEFDADRVESPGTATEYMTEQNRFEISCGTCFKTLYADSETSESLLRSIEEGLDNPYLCGECQEEFEEEAYEKR